jgi:sulfoxide reductase heme-binding subunit YedZ
MARIATRAPIRTAPESVKAGATRLDAWMAEEVRIFGSYIKRQTIALWILGAPALLPIIFTIPAIATRNGKALDATEADVLGSGAAILLFCTLLVSPLMTVTRQRWFFPLRRWYGLVMAATAFTDAGAAAVTTSFAGGVLGRLTGHSFVLVGFTMVLILAVLFVTGNHAAQRKLGRYWRPLHRLTYVVWGLLVLHLVLLQGLGIQSGTNGPDNNNVDGLPLFHQRLYQVLACSLFPFVFRLPPVKRWVAEKQEEGRGVVVFWAVVPMMLLFLLAFTFIVNEEFFKGMKLVTLNTNGGG